ncbi:hypothetical protein TWF506_004074 [Arthrobotrys conoides]|uniref:Uncharacterized protein n=1 Tax=Arthrobotrys conoides TaxID=74498 RepID=A0AAN8N748_9PEZI
MSLGGFEVAERDKISAGHEKPDIYLVELVEDVPFVLADVVAVAFQDIPNRNSVRHLVERHRPAPEDALRHCDMGTYRYQNHLPERNMTNEASTDIIASRSKPIDMYTCPPPHGRTTDDPPMHANRPNLKKSAKQNRSQTGRDLKKILMVA